MLDSIRAQHEAELEQMRKEHAAEVIDLLESLTSGNWQEALDVARDCDAYSQTDLWAAVIENLQLMLRQEAQRPDLVPEAYNYIENDDDLPF